MLGEKIGEGTGKVTLQRVLPGEGGAPRMETSFSESGMLFGVPTKETGTYWSAMRPDGSLYGEGQGITMSPQGDAATWVGQGVGTFKPDGSVSFRGAIYFQTSSPKWASLNKVAGVYEHEVDAQGNTRTQLYEWK